MEAARAIITHLLAIRAGRDRHHDRMGTLFDRHPVFIQTLFQEARGLVPIMFKGLIRPSRVTEDEPQQVNSDALPMSVDQHVVFSMATVLPGGARPGAHHVRGIHLALAGHGERAAADEL